MKLITPGDIASEQRIQGQTQANLIPGLCHIHPPAELEAGRGSERRKVMGIPLSSGRGLWEGMRGARSQTCRTLEIIGRTLDFCRSVLGRCQRVLSKSDMT